MIDQRLSARRRCFCSRLLSGGFGDASFADFGSGLGVALKLPVVLAVFAAGCVLPLVLAAGLVVSPVAGASVLGLGSRLALPVLVAGWVVPFVLAAGLVVSLVDVAGDFRLPLLVLAAGGVLSLAGLEVAWALPLFFFASGCVLLVSSSLVCLPVGCFPADWPGFGFGRLVEVVIFASLLFPGPATSAVDAQPQLQNDNSRSIRCKRLSVN